MVQNSRDIKSTRIQSDTILNFERTTNRGSEMNRLVKNLKLVKIKISRFGEYKD